MNENVDVSIIGLNKYSKLEISCIFRDIFRDLNILINPIKPSNVMKNVNICSEIILSPNSMLQKYPR